MYCQRLRPFVWNALESGKRMKNTKKRFFRPIIQLLSTLALNLNITGFAEGSIYTGSFKGVCVPVLNCYSCPGALGACPIGALQSSFAAIGGRLAYYVLGMLLLFALTLGRFFCGWLCPFGALQGLIYKVPVRKAEIPKRADAALRYLKYAVLVVLVVALPLFMRNGVDMSAPYFCKWLCPAGTLEGGVPLALTNEMVRGALGAQFAWKLSLAVGIVVLCLFLYRPFCKYLCPLGAFYGLFSKLSLYRYAVDSNACTQCGACRRACKMGVDPMREPNSRECIRCGDCKRACPVGALKNSTCFGEQKQDSIKKGDVR